MGKTCPRPCINVLSGLLLLLEHHTPQLSPASSRLQTSQTWSPGFSPEPSWCEDLGPSQYPHVSAAPNRQYTHGSGHLPKEEERPDTTFGKFCYNSSFETEGTEPRKERTVSHILDKNPGKTTQHRPGYLSSPSGVWKMLSSPPPTLS